MDKNRILIELSESERSQLGREDFAAQSLPQKFFSSIWAVESEVNNGGFSQYFQSSSSAETAPFVVQALETIGAPRTAEICRQAIACVFPAGLPPITEEICSTAEDISDETLDELEAFDTAFMQYPHNLTDLLFGFVSRNPQEFGPLPEAE